jgi:hypothetical protein
VASDIVDRLDRRGLDGVRFHICNFLEESPVRSAWSIACNPHFDHIKAFCERGLEIATYKVAVIVPLRRLPAARWLANLPLESIYLLTPRPSMPPGEWIAAGNVPGGGREDFCWLVFNSKRIRFTRACAGWLVTWREEHHHEHTTPNLRLEATRRLHTARSAGHGAFGGFGTGRTLLLAVHPLR